MKGFKKTKTKTHEFLPKNKQKISKMADGGGSHTKINKQEAKAELSQITIQLG